jgi:hypothetical protein
MDSVAQAAASTNVAASPLRSWPANVAAAAIQLGRSLGGGFGPDPAATWGVGALAFTGAAAWLLVAAARSDGGHPARRLPLTVTAVCLLGLPLANQNWDGFLEARYLSFLVPLVAMAGAIAVVAPGPRRGRLAAFACVLALTVVPAARVVWYVADATRSDLSNAPLLALVDEAAAARQAGLAIVVDEGLKGLAWPHRGDPRRAMTYYLTLAGVGFESTGLDKIRHYIDVEHRPIAAFLAAESAGSLATRLEEVSVRRFPAYPAWGLYRTKAD